MENISVPSRFSCLKIEDDEFLPVSNKSSKKKIVENKQINKKGSQNSVNIKKSQAKQDQSSNSSSKKPKSKSKSDGKQWEEWQKKDSEYVDENFEQDLQSAILQSKLDYENQKKHSTVLIANKDSSASKKKKAKTMSLDQFLEGDNNASSKKESIETKTKDSEENFFESIVNSAKEEIRKEKIEEKRRERSSNIEEVISLAQCQEKLQKEREINNQLKNELEEAKKEIVVVKKRNKMLCSMLSQGEMKDKATVLLELEKLTVVKEELTDEVARLHKLLEQERSKSNSANISSTNIAESHNKQKKQKKKT